MQRGAVISRRCRAAGAVMAGGRRHVGLGSARLLESSQESSYAATRRGADGAISKAGITALALPAAASRARAALRFALRADLLTVTLSRPAPEEVTPESRSSSALLYLRRNHANAGVELPADVDEALLAAEEQVPTSPEDYWSPALEVRACLASTCTLGPWQLRALRAPKHQAAMAAALVHESWPSLGGRERAPERAGPRDTPLCRCRTTM